jgi:hypothetical protein
MSPDINPFSIPIGTSDPIDLCQGLPLVPSFGTARAGATGAARSEKLFDVGITILATRINASSYYSWGFGVCGPAIGFLSRNVDVLRENVGSRGQLTLTFNEGLEMQAGLFVGAFVGIGLTLSVQLYLPRPWWKVWSFAWQDAFAINVGYNIDLLALLVQLIQHMLSRNSKSSFVADNQNRLRDALPDLKQTFAMVDSAGSRNAVEKDLTATPQLTLPFNLVNYFPPLKALNDGLAKIGGEMSVGPSLLLQFPVKLNFTGFTVEGGLEGRGQGDRADYGGIDYNGKVLSATGPTRFDTDVKPSQFTSHVRYESRFAVGISVHFKVVVAKFFNIEVNSVSLDLSYLLTGIRQHLNLPPVERSVSTGVQGSCVLTPNMTLAFEASSGNRTNLTTGQRLRGTVRLPGFRSAKNAHVTIEIEPPVSGFPTTVTIPAGGNSASFEYTFQNQCLSTGNRNNLSEVAPPSPVTPLETYTVSARLASDDEVTNGCTDYHVQAPLNIEERYIRCQRSNTTIAGPAPPWDRLAGATINANPSLPGGGSKSDSATFSLWFPYLGSEPDARVPVTFTLLDENRQPYARSNVQIVSFQGLPPTTLKPSATGTLSLARSPGGALAGVNVAWKSTGPATGYANRFYLIVNAGCRYGQTEFWLNVWNWS